MLRRETSFAINSPNERFVEYRLLGSNVPLNNQAMIDRRYFEKLYLIFSTVQW
jgi:hypothetical protein